MNACERIDWLPIIRSAWSRKLIDIKVHVEELHREIMVIQERINNLVKRESKILLNMHNVV